MLAALALAAAPAAAAAQSAPMPADIAGGRLVIALRLERTIYSLHEPVVGRGEVLRAPELLVQSVILLRGLQ